MKDALQAIGAMIVLLIVALLRLSWVLIRICVFVGVLVGAALIVFKGEDSEFVRNWMVITVTIIFISTRTAARAAESAEQMVEHVRLGVVALGNYCKMEVETDLVRARKEGQLKRNLMSSWLSQLVFGRDTDDGLTSRPVRGGKSISLHEDMVEAMREGQRSALDR